MALLLASCLPQGCIEEINNYSDLKIDINRFYREQPKQKPQADFTRSDPRKGCTRLYNIQLSGKERLIFVDAAAKKNGDGISWDSASKSIAHALELGFKARQNGDTRGITLIVAGGKYGFSQEKTSAMADNASIIGFVGSGSNIFKNIKILGGFRPSDECLEVNLNLKADPGSEKEREVILDGEFKSNHVVKLASNAQDIVLKDLTITRGNSNDYGGGILVSDGTKNILLEGIKILNSKAAVSGGGLAIIKTAQDIKVNRSLIDGCSAQHNGGGVYISGLNISNVIFSDTSITHNQASQSGAGVGIIGTGQSIGNYKFAFINTLIDENEVNPKLDAADAGVGDVGGGFYVLGSSGDIKISGGSISRNKGNVRGVGLALSGNVGHVLIENTVFDANAVKDGVARNGIGIHLEKIGAGELEDITLSGIKISNHENGSKGAGLYAEGISNLNLNNTNFFQNKSINGGAAFFDKSNVTINGGQFSANSAEFGGALYFNSQKSPQVPTIIKNVTLENNSSTRDGGGIYLFGTASAVLNFATFKDNRAINGSGGSLYLDDLEERIEINNSQFQGGRAALNAGGIYVLGSDGLGDKAFTMDSVSIENCAVTTPAAGTNGAAGIFLSKIKSAMITASKFINNRVENSDPGNAWAAALKFLDYSGALPPKNPAFGVNSDPQAVKPLLDPMAAVPVTIIGPIELRDNKVFTTTNAQNAASTGGMSIPQALHDTNYLLVGPGQSGGSVFEHSGNVPPLPILEPNDNPRNMIKTH